MMLATAAAIALALPAPEAQAGAAGGRVTWVVTGKAPPTPAVVAAWQGGWAPVAITETNPGGYYFFPDLEPGPVVLVTAWKSGELSMWTGKAETFIVGGGFAWADLRLSWGGK